MGFFSKVVFITVENVDVVSRKVCFGFHVVRHPQHFLNSELARSLIFEAAVDCQMADVLFPEAPYEKHAL